MFKQNLVALRFRITDYVVESCPRLQIMGTVH